MGIPYGLICTCLGVALGGMLGRALRRWIRDELREKLPMLCGITAICSGILSVIRADQMPVVTFSVLLGGWLGVLLRLEQRVRNGFGWVLGKLSLPEDFDMEQYITIVAVFCCSGFGLYGVMVEGFSGEHTQMYSKAMMDLIVAVVFGGSMGMAVSVIALPQAAVYLTFFFLAKLLMPVMSQAMLLNFIACGGVLTVAAGMRMAKIRAYPLIDMLPSLALIFPFTLLWDWVRAAGL